MSNHAVNSVPMPPARKASTFKKLIQAAVLAAVLIPLGTVAVETASVTCRFNTSGEGGYGGMYCGGGDNNYSQNQSFFDFGDYYLELLFDMDGAVDFDVTVNTTVLSSTDFATRASAFPGYTCLALNAAGDCVDFEVVPTKGQEGNWTHYEIEIGWFKYDDLPVYDESRMRILHGFGGSDGDTLYDEDMCVTALDNSSYDLCVAIADPSIRSGNTDFQHFIAAYSPTSVPEPSSLVLLGTGVCGLLLRRRRRA